MWRKTRSILIIGECDEYVKLGGASLSRKALVQRLLTEYKNEVILLSSPGIANILVFKAKMKMKQSFKLL